MSGSFYLSALLIIILLFLFLVLRLILKSFQNKQTKHQNNPARFGIAFEEVSIPAKNNCTLYGWLMKRDSGFPTLILVHGWGRNVERTLPYIRHLSDKDFNLLTFDSRHHGSSDRDDFSTMVKFAEDISATLDFIHRDKYFANKSIGLVGLSIGGAASIFAASNDPRISSVVTVGAFANPLDVMKQQLKQHHMPYIPVGWGVITLLQSRVGFKFADVAPEKHISHSDADFLLIHGDKDETIPPAHLRRLYDASKDGNASMWLIENRNHSDCHLEEDFWLRISEHFQKTLK